MFKPGTYRVYEILHNQGKPHDQLVARFLIDDGAFHILEDYNHVLVDSLPEGLYDEGHEKVLTQLSQSGYFKVIHEKEANEGHHEDLIEDLDVGDVEPDAEFLIHEDPNPPQTLQMYGQIAILDGKKISDEELQHIMDKVKSGEFTMHPY